MATWNKLYSAKRGDAKGSCWTHQLIGLLSRAREGVHNASRPRGVPPCLSQYPDKVYVGVRMPRMEEQREVEPLGEL
jgi:hypothetical protein